MIDLCKFSLSDMTRIGAEIRTLASKATSMEALAQNLVRLFHGNCRDPKSGEPTTALVRLYLTQAAGRLPPSVEAFARKLVAADVLGADVRCLTLLATAGLEPDWNRRERSRGHQAIPLPNSKAVDSIPMISQLLMQLGMDVASVVAPDPSLIMEMDQATYNVFYVPEATGSLHIPAQDGFVAPYGIRSVLGYGGVLPTGDIFAILLFTRVFIERHVADMFRNAALNTKLALLPFCKGPIFSPGAVRS